MRSSSFGGEVRRVSLTDALRSTRPDPLSTVDLKQQAPVEGTASAALRDDDEITDTLYRHLRAGRAEKAIGLIQLLFLAGRSVAQIVDSSFRLALSRVGKDSVGSDAGEASWEHRATQICIRILHEFPLGSQAGGHSMVAVGGAPEHDPYVLPAMAAATVLESVGFDVTNLGPQTSTDTFVQTVREVQPALVFLSVTAKLDSTELPTEIEEILEAADCAGAALMIGGQHAHGLQLPDHPRLWPTDTMVELAAFAAGLAHGASSRRTPRP